MYLLQQQEDLCGWSGVSERKSRTRLSQQFGQSRMRYVGYRMLWISLITSHHQIGLLFAPGLYVLKSLLERLCLKVLLLNNLIKSFPGTF